jgi:hypothetical protein
MSGIKTFVQTDLRTPPTEETHLVRLKDMRDYIASLTTHPVNVALTAPFTATYSASNKTLTQNVPDALEIDGVPVAVGDRILITKQLDKTQNGIYEVTVLGVTGTTAAVLTRASDFNDSSKIQNGMIVPVSNGDANAGTNWKLTTGAVPFVLDSVTLDFAKDAVDFTKVVEAELAVEGDTTTTDYSFEHNWDTLNITHELFENATGETVVACFKRLDSNNVQVIFSEPLGVGNDMTLVIRAQIDPV